MKHLVSVAVALLFSSCADTTLWQNGQKVARIQSNATNVTVQTPEGTYFHADLLDNTGATLAGAESARGIIGAVGQVATPFVLGLGPLAASQPVAAVVGSAIPATVHSAQAVVRPTNININNPPQSVLVPTDQIVTIQNPNGVTQTFRIAKVKRRRHHQ